MIPFNEITHSMYRALLANADDVAKNGDNAEVSTSHWYDEEPPMDELVKKAKELDKDVITIETHTITLRNYEVK